MRGTVALFGAARPQSGGPARGAARAALLAALVLALAGCGGGDKRRAGDEDGDPATVAPARTLFYATAYLRPRGAVKASVDPFLARVLATAQPDGPLRELVERLLARSGAGLRYEEEVRPWLGRRAALAAVPTGPGSTDAVLIFASKDDDAARQALDRRPGRGPERTYREARYSVDRNGNAAGLVGHFVVFGGEAALRATAEGAAGTSLAEAPAYRTALGDRAGAALGAAYLDVPALARDLVASLPDDQRTAVAALLGTLRIGPASGLLDARGDRLVVDASMALSGPGAPEAVGAPSLLDDLPGDAWAATGLPRVGDAVRKLVNAAIGGGLIGGAVRIAVEERVREQTGLSLSNDVEDALGDVAAFERGVRPGRRAGSVVVRTDDPDALADALENYAELLRRRTPGLQVSEASVAGAKGFVLKRPTGAPLFLLERGDRGVLAVGEAAARTALSPRLALESTPLFAAAETALQPFPVSAFLAAAPAVAAARATGGAGDPDFRALEPVLARLRFAAAGARRQGGKVVARVFLVVGSPRSLPCPRE
ncbi:MAG: DUF3352 domain-containing protein, partial [Solirubrobacteraceae bacterium]